MKKDLFLRSLIKLFIPMTILSLGACNSWDDHYAEESYDIPETTILDYINSRTDLSIFAEYAKTSGCDDILNSSQSYTLFVPTNDALTGLSLTDDELELFVKNHITRGRVTTTKSAVLPMVNNKNVDLTVEGSSYMFGKGNITEPNVLCKNGLVQVVDQYAPYLNNLYEYLADIDDIDSIMTYIYSHQIKTFDLENSPELGVDTNGMAVYDSSFIYENEVLDEIGAIDDEDSVYTVIYPTNDAYTKAYNHIAPYYVCPDVSGGEARQKMLTKFLLTQDLAFRGEITDPSSLDSIVSVSSTGNVYHDPSSLFANTDKYEASNGIVHVTDSFPYPDSTLFLKDIKIEAESNFYDVAENTSASIGYYFGDDLDVSNNRFLKVVPDGSTVTKVAFRLPGMLATKYNVYCVFVPLWVMNPDLKKTTEVKFKVSYYKYDNNNTGSLNSTPSDNRPSKTEMTKMYVGQIDNKSCDIIHDKEEDILYTSITIQNKVKDSDVDEDLSRNMLIDCIILEPVIE